MSRKNLLIVIVIIAVVILAGLLLYFFVFRSESPPFSSSSEESDSESLSLAEDGVFTVDGDTAENPAAVVAEVGADTDVTSQIVSESESEAAERIELYRVIIDGDVIGAEMTPAGDRVQYYSADSQEIKSVTYSGRDPVVLMSLSHSAVDIIWSPDRQKLIYLSESGQYYYANIETGEEVELIDDISSPQFASGDNQAAYFYNNTETGISSVSLGSLSEGLADGRGLVQVKGNVKVAPVPGQDLISYYLTPSITRSANLYRVNNSGTVQELILGKDYGIDVIYSPDGSKMLYNKRGQKTNRPELWLADSNGANRQKLPISTYVEKIAWSPDSPKIYLGVPTLLPPIDDFYEGATTTDHLYEIDLNVPGVATLIQNFERTGDNVDMRDLFLTSSGKFLYFRDTKTNSLYCVNISLSLLTTE